MFSAENNINNNKLVHGGGYWDWDWDWEEGFGGGVMSSTTQVQVQGGYDSCSLGSADHQRSMAEEQSSMNEAAGSSSKDHVQQEDEGWLQLSIGTAGYTNHKKLDQSDHQAAAAPPRPVELELLPSSTSTSQIFLPLTATVAPPPPPRLPVMNYSTPADHGALFFLQHPAGTSTSTFPNYHHQDQIINWAYRPIPINITPPPSTSSSSTPLIMGPAASYFPRPFQVHTPPGTPSLDFRVIQPPRTPHSGIWFVLRASQNQAKEPFLPQISKSYLRIKDGRMTIGLVKKYLVNKLSLEDESEIEITCKGQELLPFLTLQHVRDNIWSQRDFVTLLPNSSSATDQIMVLFYGRSASN